MYRDQVIALLKDQLTLEIEIGSHYNHEDKYKEKHVINLCLGGEIISTVDLEEF